MEFAEVLDKVMRLRWRLAKPVQSLLVGPYRSAFRGEGIEFADARPYEIGDDWRRLHWSLTARKNQPYLRLGQEERELTCLIAIDRSPSMRISSEKQNLTLTVAVSLALSALLNSDRVQWLSFGEQVEYFSPARKGEKFTWGALSRLWNQTSRAERSYLSPMLHWVASVHRRRILLIIVSDLFFHDQTGWTLLNAMAHQHFTLIVGVRTLQEAYTPAWGYLPVKDVETGEVAIHRREDSLPVPAVSRLRLAYVSSEKELFSALGRAFLTPLQ
ncbi:MAG: DUF58 domain-containing protein [Bacteroidia bacterium]|nr:DUF58 domain-containing protein [Bacteroidia bacterium]MCX7651633.1 DUF58 domain-containing protein [Bacteroidia bacterium]MDW8415959.1 DUF58 domain-containing protein [Bacteroidia bacterium]